MDYRVVLGILESSGDAIYESYEAAEAAAAGSSNAAVESDTEEPGVDFWNVDVFLDVVLRGLAKAHSVEAESMKARLWGYCVVLRSLHSHMLANGIFPTVQSLLGYCRDATKRDICGDTVVMLDQERRQVPHQIHWAVPCQSTGSDACCAALLCICGQQRTLSLLSASTWQRDPQWNEVYETQHNITALLVLSSVQTLVLANASGCITFQPIGKNVPRQGWTMKLSSPVSTLAWEQHACRLYCGCADGSVCTFILDLAKKDFDPKRGYVVPRSAGADCEASAVVGISVLDNTHVVFVYSDKIVLCRCSTGAVLRRCLGHEKQIACCDVSVLDRLLITAGEDKRVYLWFLCTLFATPESHGLTPLRPVVITSSTPHHEAITDILLRSSLFLTADSKGVVKMWSLRALTCIRTVRVASAATAQYKLSWMPSGLAEPSGVLACGGMSGGSLFIPIPENANTFLHELIAIAYDGDRDMIVTATRSCCHWWSILTGLLVKSLPLAIAGGISCILVLPENSRLAVGSKSGSVAIHSPVDGSQHEGCFSDYHSEVVLLQLHSRSAVVIGHRDGAIRVCGVRGATTLVVQAPERTLPSTLTQACVPLVACVASEIVVYAKPHLAVYSCNSKFEWSQRVQQHVSCARDADGGNPLAKAAATADVSAMCAAKDFVGVFLVHGATVSLWELVFAGGVVKRCELSVESEVPDSDASPVTHVAYADGCLVTATARGCVSVYFVNKAMAVWEHTESDITLAACWRCEASAERAGEVTSLSAMLCVVQHCSLVTITSDTHHVSSVAMWDLLGERVGYVAEFRPKGARPEAGARHKFYINKDWSHNLSAGKQRFLKNRAQAHVSRWKGTKGKIMLLAHESAADSEKLSRVTARAWLKDKVRCSASRKDKDGCGVAVAIPEAPRASPLPGALLNIPRQDMTSAEVRAAALTPPVLPAPAATISSPQLPQAQATAPVSSPRFQFSSKSSAQTECEHVAARILAGQQQECSEGVDVKQPAFVGGGPHETALPFLRRWLTPKNVVRTEDQNPIAPGAVVQCIGEQNLRDLQPNQAPACALTVVAASVCSEAADDCQTPDTQTVCSPPGKHPSLSYHYEMKGGGKKVQCAVCSECSHKFEVTTTSWGQSRLEQQRVRRGKAGEKQPLVVADQEETPVGRSAVTPVYRSPFIPGYLRNKLGPSSFPRHVPQRSGFSKKLVLAGFLIPDLDTQPRSHMKRVIT